MKTTEKKYELIGPGGLFGLMRENEYDRNILTFGEVVQAVSEDPSLAIGRYLMGDTLVMYGETILSTRDKLPKVPTREDFETPGCGRRAVDYRQFTKLFRGQIDLKRENPGMDDLLRCVTGIDDIMEKIKRITHGKFYLSIPKLRKKVPKFRVPVIGKVKGDPIWNIGVVNHPNIDKGDKYLLKRV
jgi:hypothetical protein